MGGEVFFIMIIALILFGPEELPKIARGVGRMIYEIKKSIGEVQSEIRDAADFDSEQAAKSSSEEPQDTALDLPNHEESK